MRDNRYRANDYITKFVNNGGIFAIEHTENDIYMIGNSFEALLEDFSHKYPDRKKADCRYILESLQNYCLDTNDKDFYKNVEKAIRDVMEVL